MSDNKERYFDLRTRERYLKKGLTTQKEIDSYLKNLPNEEKNFELTTFDDDDLGIGNPLSEEDLKNMPPISEDEIDAIDLNQ